uniref:Uncharacterized protein n=1 Tax=Arundo donax TaxID=35708 RepID=A0A0A9FQB6_ARUDO
MGRSPIGRPSRRSRPAREPPGMSSSASAAGASPAAADADGTTAWRRTTWGASAASMSISASRAAEGSPAAKSLSASGCAVRRWRALYTVPPFPCPRTENLS